MEIKYGTAIFTGKNAMVTKDGQPFGKMLEDAKWDEATKSWIGHMQILPAGSPQMEIIPPTVSPRDERRLRILQVPMTVLESILFSWKDWPNIALPRWNDVPPTAKVVSVNFDFSSRCFQLMLGDASFEPVADGDKIPLLNDSWCIECVTMRRIRDEGFSPPSPDVMYMREPTAAETCPDCNGTREYRGVTTIEPCRTCCPEKS